MRILSVDDDPIILELLQAILISIGQTDVVMAESAAQALDILKDDPVPFDCFLLDIQMPETDGIQLCKTIRSTPGYQRTPILMITAMSDKIYIDRAFSAGATDYVTKPFDVVELGVRIKSAERLIDAWSQKASARQAASTYTSGDKTYTLAEKLPIHDVDGVVDYVALENYVRQLSRGLMFGSTILAFSIADIDRIFKSTSAFDFEALVTDVSEAITFCLKLTQHLVAYAGNGTYVCITGAGEKIVPEVLQADLRDVFDIMCPCYSDGRPILPSVYAGDLIKLTFRSKQNVLKALSQACLSAQNKSNVASHISGSDQTSLAG